MKRPLVWMAAAMASGVYAVAWGLPGGLAISALLCVAGTILPIALKPRALSQPLATALAFCGLGMLLWEAHHVGPPGDALSRWATEHRNAFVELEGTVWQPDLIIADRDYASFILDVDRVRTDGAPMALPGRTHVRWYGPDRPLANHERVRVRGELSPELGHLNPGVQDVEDYLRRRGVHTALHVTRHRGLDIVGRAPWWSPMYWASRLRHAQAERLRDAVPEPAYAFVLAVWLGDRREIKKDELQAYIASGTAHILAVSGVHMAILYTSVAFILKLLWPNRVRLRAVLTLIVIFAFAGVTGARISSLRAACMIALYLLADVLERDPDAPTAISLAAILFMVASPEALLDVGFLLSFGSVASLLLFRDSIDSWLVRLTMPDPTRNLVVSQLTWRERLQSYLESRRGPTLEVLAGLRRIAWGARGGLATSLAVQILPLPLAVHYFHVFPLAAPFVNLLVVPLVGVILWMCLLTSAAAFVAPPVAPLFGHALAVPVRAVELLASWTESSGAYALVTSPSVTGFVSYWIFAALVYLALRGRLRVRRQLVSLPACGLVCIGLWTPWRPPPEVVFLDVGHGDCAFIRMPGGATALVDTGDRSEFVDSGERFVAPFLWANHVRRIDYLFLTHSDSDHIGGADYLFRHFRIGAVLLNAVAPDDATKRLLAQCASLGVPVRRLTPGETVRSGPAVITVLHPPPGWPGNPVNDASLVLKLAWPGMDVLLAGDIEQNAESVVALGPCAATVLKVPHHGSITSSTNLFLDAVRPRLAVISGVELAQRGMHPVVLERYRARGIPTLRTDVHGAITLRVKKEALAATSERARRDYLYERRPSLP